MRLPKVLQDIILDYYWSHKTYLRLQRALRTLRVNAKMAQMRRFYTIFSTIAIELEYNL